MTTFELYAVAGVLVFLVGLFRLVTSLHLLRLVLALHVMGSGAFLVLIATAYRDRAPEADPVPHAMVLTGIVVTTSVTAFLVTLVRRLHAEGGSEELVTAGVEMEGSLEGATQPRGDTEA